MEIPALLEKTAITNKTHKRKTINLVFPASNCFNPSKFRYLTRETIKNAKNNTINRNITGTNRGKGEKSLPFLNISIKEANMPPLTVVGKP